MNQITYYLMSSINAVLSLAVAITVFGFMQEKVQSIRERGEISERSKQIKPGQIWSATYKNAFKEKTYQYEVIDVKDGMVLYRLAQYPNDPGSAESCYSFAEKHQLDTSPRGERK